MVSRGLATPLHGGKGEHTSLHNYINKITIKKTATRKYNNNSSIYWKEVSLQFDVKDRTKFEQKHDVVYLGTRLECNDNNIDEIKCRTEQRMKDHNGKDRNPHLFKRFLEKNH